MSPVSKVNKAIRSNTEFFMISIHSVHILNVTVCILNNKVIFLISTTNWVAGYECITDAPESETKLFLDFDMIPAYTASLYWFEYTGD